MGFFTKLLGIEEEKKRKRATKKKSTHIRIDLEEVLGKFFYKEEVQDICDDLGLNTKGKKDDLIDSILEEPDLNPKKMLRHLDVETLKDLCEALDEYKSGTKADLIKRIVPHIDIEQTVEEKKQPLPSPPPDYQEEKKQQKEPEYDEDIDNVITLQDLLKKYYYKEDVQYLLKKQKLREKGVKANLIERVLNESNYTIEEILKALNVDQLKDVCYDVGEYRTGTKNELIERVIPHIRIEEIKPKPTPKKEIAVITQVDKAETKSQDYEIDYSLDIVDLCNDINNWIPGKRYSSEEGYRVDLLSFLKHKCNYNVKQEAGETKADLLVEGSIPIEMKKNPNQSAYDRLFGQLMRHKRAYGKVIVVICDVTRLEQFEDFEYNIRDQNDVMMIKK